jgi:hypothetical protein
MDGHASDLRTGLPWQMVEIHEPVRVLFVIETAPERLMKVVECQPLADSSWWRTGGFAWPPSTRRPAACTSAETAALRSSMRPVERIARWLYLPPNGMPANSNIFRWPGFNPMETKPIRDADFLQATLVVCGAGARSCLRFALALLWLLGWVPSERVLSRITALTFSASIFAIAVTASGVLVLAGTRSVTVTFGNWFAVHDYHFPLVLMADRLSVPFLGLTVCCPA